MEFKVDCRRIAAKKGIDIRAGGDRFEPQVQSSGRLVPGRKSSEPGRRNKMTPSSTIEFLIWLLIAASFIAVLAARLRVPYTVALVVGGLLLGSFHLPACKTYLRTPQTG